MLREVADRLKSAVRDSDTVARGTDKNHTEVARLGGDEFTVLLTDLRNGADAAVVAQRIRGVLSAPMELGGYEVVVTPSIGIALFPGDARDAETLLRFADIAMYQAKRDGKNGWRFYAGKMNTQSLERLQLEAHLRRAIEAQQFRLFYQPQINLMSGELVGFEALVRWQHPDLGLVSPGSFIPLAEETGLIIPMGEWVIDEACRQLSLWQRAGHRVGGSVNGA